MINRTVFYALAVCMFFGFQSHAGAMGMGGLGGGDPDVEFTSRIVNQIGVFTSPSRVALTSTGELYVADSRAGTVAIYDTSGRRVGTLNGVGSPLGVDVLETTQVLCFNQKGKQRRCLAKDKKNSSTQEVPVVYTWVADQSDHSVKRFVGYEKSGFLGAGAGEFVKPNGIAATEDRTVYVVDSGVHKVAVYNPAGELEFQFGAYGTGDGELDFPTDIAISEAANEVYVGDFGNRRVVIFDLEGNWLRNVTAPLNDGGDPAFIGPAGLGLDPSGNLYVTDNALSCVVIMDNMGNLLDIIGYQQGTYWTGDLEVPIDVVSDGMRVYVTSSGHGHVNVFDGPFAEGAQ